MDAVKNRYAAFVDILKYELMPASGCTEPIAIAYAASMLRKVMGRIPDSVVAFASGNLIKNAKAVSIPNGGDLRGIDAAVVMGILSDGADRKLEVLESLPEGALDRAKQLLADGYCTVLPLDSAESLHLVLSAVAGEESAEVELKYAHTNIVRIEKNGESLMNGASGPLSLEQKVLDYGVLNVRDILDFVNTFDIKAGFVDLLRKQIEYNMAIAREGLSGSWGVNVGQAYKRRHLDVQAYAAAASDARMSGCNLPVMIISGSGNQGITASLPVVVYAQEHWISEEHMLRALALSDLVAIHLKSGVGRLSAYCGAVCAACGSGCAMTYMDGGTLEQIEMTLTNTVAVISGMICDGAKSSCAGKIATSIECAMMAHELAMDGKAYKPGEGIVFDGIENTINNVGRIAKEGMRETDRVILSLMTD